MLTLSILLTAALFGSMLFFSFVMAPLVFTQLQAEIAGRFIRAVFPWYYALLGSLSALAGLTSIPVAPLQAGLLLGVASLALFSRQLLMPQINRLRDRSQQGDELAESRFNQLHGLSVVINFVQLAVVTLVLVLLVPA